MHPREPLDVVVVGGGVSGLTTAVVLAESGLRVEVWTRHEVSRTTSAVAEASGTATSTLASTVTGSSTSTESVVPPSESGPVISLNPNNPVWDSSFTGPFDSIRGPLGATIIGPNNPNIAQQNPDLFAPPTTDHGDV